MKFSKISLLNFLMVKTITFIVDHNLKIYLYITWKFYVNVIIYTYIQLNSRKQSLLWDIISVRLLKHWGYTLLVNAMVWIVSPPPPPKRLKSWLPVPVNVTLYVRILQMWSSEDEIIRLGPDPIWLVSHMTTGSETGSDTVESQGRPRIDGHQ